MPVITGAAAYPENLAEKIRATGVDLDAIDALSLAERAGSSKAVNIVLMADCPSGSISPRRSGSRPLSRASPPKFLELNRRAFALGREA